MPEIIVYSAFQAIVLLDMLPKKRYNLLKFNLIENNKKGVLMDK